jgi:cytoskeleton protein RodZ
MGELGDRLRLAREAKGLTLEQVEAMTKIRRRYLQALEEENYGQLPGEVFVRGFLRNYALALGLDPQEIIKASGREAPPPPVVPDDNHRKLLDEPLPAGRAGGQRWMAVVITAMLVIALGLGTWAVLQYAGPGKPSPTPALAQVTETLAQVAIQNTPSPTLLPTATPSITPTTPQATQAPSPSSTPGALTVRVLAAQDAWVRATVDGKVAFEATLKAGQSREWVVKDKITLVCGNAGGLQVWLNGQEQKPLGDAGQVVEKTWSAIEAPAASGGTPQAQGTPGPMGTPPKPTTPTSAATAKPTSAATTESKPTSAPTAAPTNAPASAPTNAPTAAPPTATTQPKPTNTTAPQPQPTATSAPQAQPSATTTH